MSHPPSIRHLCTLSVALMLAACGGETDGSFENFPARARAELMTKLSAQVAAQPAATHSQTLAGVHDSLSASITLQPPEQSPRAMAAFENLGNTGYANATLQFLIHSIGPNRLTKHLGEFAQRSDAAHGAAARGMIELIKNTYSEAEPAQLGLAEFLQSLQQLPEFTGFPIVGTQHEAGEFLAKLSQAFALNEINAGSMALHDDNNGLKAEAQYWTILKPAGAEDSLQEVFDRTPATGWSFEPQKGMFLTVAMDNSSHDEQSTHSHRNFDFNQTVQLKIIQGNQTEILTLEPREVVEFRGTGNDGHYVVHAKDEQWVRYDGKQVTMPGRMPSIENARLINFAVREIETRAVRSSADAS